MKNAKPYFAHVVDFLHVYDFVILFTPSSTHIVDLLHTLGFVVKCE